MIRVDDIQEQSANRRVRAEARRDWLLSEAGATMWRNTGSAVEMLHMLNAAQLHHVVPFRALVTGVVLYEVSTIRPANAAQVDAAEMTATYGTELTSAEHSSKAGQPNIALVLSREALMWWRDRPELVTCKADPNAPVWRDTIGRGILETMALILGCDDGLAKPLYWMRQARTQQALTGGGVACPEHIAADFARSLVNVRQMQTVVRHHKGAPIPDVKVAR